MNIKRRRCNVEKSLFDKRKIRSRAVMRIISLVLVTCFVISANNHFTQIVSAYSDSDIYNGSFGPVYDEIKENARRDFVWPLKPYKGYNVYNFIGCFYDGRNHRAIDISCYQDTPVVASYDGKVVRYSENANQAFGRYIELEHQYKLNNGKTITLYTRYKHLHTISDTTKAAYNNKSIIHAGEEIGKAGHTSNANIGNHLDFSILYGGLKQGYNDYSIDPFGNNLLELPDGFYRLGKAPFDEIYYSNIIAQYSVPICEHDFDTIDGTCIRENCNVKFDYMKYFDSNYAGIYRYKGVLTDLELKQEPYPNAKKLAHKWITGLADLTIYGSVMNAHQEMWYKFKMNGMEGWISASKLDKTAELPTRITASLDSPSGTIEAKKAHDVTGTITSNKTITKIVGWVENAAGKIILQKVEYKPEKTTVTLYRTPIDTGLKFDKLTEPGTYFLKLQVTAGGETEPFSFPFMARNSAKPTCATPSIIVSDEFGGKSVALSSSGAKLYYTTDGSEPGTGSMVYTAPFELKDSAMIKVLAVRDGYNSSRQSRYVEVPSSAMPDVDIVNTPLGTWVMLTSGEPGAKIFYTLGDGQEAQCESGTGFYVTENATLIVHAVRSGTNTSEYGYYDIHVSVPEVPIVDTASQEVAVGEYAGFLWQADQAAGSYRVTLRRNGTVIHQGMQTENTLNWKAETAGEYSLTVEAVNAVGSSAASEVVSVTAHAPLTVRFLDAETEAVLTELSVAYGGKIPSVNPPSRRGYEFTGWNLRGSQVVSSNGYLYETVTENRDYIANYKPKPYKVTFLNTEGSQIVTQEVEFGGAAVPPDYSASVPTGCVFSGWSVVHADDNSSLCDYTQVDANLELQAVVRWANMELPVVATIGEASTAAGTGYVIPVTLTNWDKASSDVWVCYALKTENENGVEKTVYTDREALTLQAGETRSVSPAKVLTYPGNASSVEVLVLERKSDGTTGSAYSQSASKRIIASSSWSDWSEWSTTEPAAQDNRVIETMTQYRYRTKETTTSSEPELSGWTLSGSTTYWSEYGPWSEWSLDPISEDEATQVETTALYRYYYFYCQTCCGHEPFQGPSDCGKYTIIATDWHEKWFPIPYSQSNSKVFSYSQRKRYTTSLGDGQIWCFSSGNLNHTAIGTKDSDSNAVVISTGYRSRTRTELTEYSYYRWSAWSAWSAQEQQTSSNVKVQTRTLYRYRDELTYYVPGQEDVEGTVHSCSGSLDIADDLSGKVATIMVYQSKNMDANQYQMKYIGQTVLGTGNSYDFSFIPASEPTADTGNYVISLGVQGTTGLLNISLIEAPKRSYTVQFYYVDGSNSIVLSTQTVEEGGAAVVPEAPQRPGYIFAGWGERSTNIITNSSIEALYVPERYAVVFVDYANQTVSVQTAVAGTAITAPPSPEAVGKTFLGWDVLLNDPVAKVTGNTVVTAVYETSSFLVRFHDAAGNLIDTQTVEYGGAASPPNECTVEDGYVFRGWEMGVMWWNVTSEMDVYPIEALAETTMAPMFSIEGETFGMSTFVEMESEPGATIFFTTDGTEPTTDSEVYTEGFYLVETSTVCAMASMEGKNDSETTYLFFAYNDAPAIEQVPDRTAVETQTLAVQPGEEFEIQVNIENNPGLRGYLLYLDCDLSTFGLNPGTENEECLIPGEVSEGGTFSLSPDGADGWQILWSGSETTTKDGVLFTLPVYMEEGESGTKGVPEPYTISLSYAPIYTYSEEFEETTANFSLNIVSCASVTLGDVNEDGEVDANDLTALARHVARIELLEKACQLEAADVNKDGSIDAADLTSLARYVAKITTSFD